MRVLHPLRQFLNRAGSFKPGNLAREWPLRRVGAQRVMLLLCGRLAYVEAIERTGAQHAAQERGGHLRVASCHIEQRADGCRLFESAEASDGLRANDRLHVVERFKQEGQRGERLYLAERTRGGGTIMGCRS